MQRGWWQNDRQYMTGIIILIVSPLISIVHCTYTRALLGGIERLYREELRACDPLKGFHAPKLGSPRRGHSLLDPHRCGRQLLSGRSTSSAYYTAMINPPRDTAGPDSHHIYVSTPWQRAVTRTVLWCGIMLVAQYHEPEFMEPHPNPFVGNYNIH